MQPIKIGHNSVLYPVVKKKAVQHDGLK